ncbi:MAG: hypothetical protein ACSHWS_09955 [Sulfitobacter sp.]
MKPNPETVEPKTSGRLRDRIKRLLSFSATIAAAGGIILGVYEYKQRGEMNQARETMTQIDVWDDKGARDAYRALAQDVALKVSQLSEEDKAAARDDRERFHQLRRNVSRDVLESSENIKRLDEVVYFFTRLALCIEAELCSAKVAKVFFEDTLNSFLMVFKAAMTDNFGKAQSEAILALQQQFGQMAD